MTTTNTNTTITKKINKQFQAICEEYKAQVGEELVFDDPKEIIDNSLVVIERIKDIFEKNNYPIWGKSTCLILEQAYHQYFNYDTDTDIIGDMIDVIINAQICDKSKHLIANTHYHMYDCLNNLDSFILEIRSIINFVNAINE